MPLKTKTVRALKKSVQSEAKSSKNIKNCIYNMISDIFKKINKTWGGKTGSKYKFYMTGENMGKFLYFPVFQILFNEYTLFEIINEYTKYIISLVKIFL